MNENVIVFKNVTKKYRLFNSRRARLLSVFTRRIKYITKVAVDNVSFKIKRGETVAILGKNGAGKSTILKIITGVAFQNEGEVEVKGRVSALLELATGFEENFTGRENIYLKGDLLGIPKDEIKELEKQIVEFAELEEYIDQPIKTYSSGMRARLGFAIYINIEPEILIVDEVLSVGDKEFEKKCLKRVNEVIEKNNVTLLFVTHSTETAKKFCKRGIILNQGKLTFDGDIDKAVELYDNSIN